jgi:Kef-type K+ transport system membrane component KefB
MILLVIIILLAAAVTGSLGAVLEVAAGVAVGLFLFVLAVGLAAYYFARHRWRQAMRDRDRYSA